MAIGCCDSFGADSDQWFDVGEAHFDVYNFKRARKCASCGDKIGRGDSAWAFPQYRCATDFEIERLGYFEEEPVAMARLWFCERCGDLGVSLHEDGYCFTALALVEQWKQYKEMRDDTNK